MTSSYRLFSLLCILLSQFALLIRSESVVDATEIDPCTKLKCHNDEFCAINIDGTAECSCLSECEDPKDERLTVCTKNNNTYISDCEFYRMQCWCRKNDGRCTQKDSVNDVIDYLGRCQDLGTCSKYELEVFPERMSIWLGETLNTSPKTGNINEKFNLVIEDTKSLKLSDNEKWWRVAVLWEFCELDKSHDKLINNEELIRFVQSLKALEHCIQPFLDSCDADENQKISADEWGLCLGLDKNDMLLLKNYCGY